VNIRTSLVASLLLLSVIGAGCGSSHHARPGRVVSATMPSLPLLPTKAGRDSVAKFPCPKPQRTTIDMESCIERRILALNARVDKLLQRTWAIERRYPIARRYFARAQRDWVRWVRGECTSDSQAWVDPETHGYAGGSEAPVLYGYCQANLTARRLRDLQRAAAVKH